MERILGGISSIDKAFQSRQAIEGIRKALPGIDPFLAGMSPEDAIKLWAEIKMKEQEMAGKAGDTEFERRHKVRQGDIAELTARSFKGTPGTAEDAEAVRRLTQGLAGARSAEVGAIYPGGGAAGAPRPDLLSQVGRVERPRSLIEAAFEKMFSPREEAPRPLRATMEPGIQGQGRAEEFKRRSLENFPTRESAVRTRAKETRKKARADIEAEKAVGAEEERSFLDALRGRKKTPKHTSGAVAG